jgi:predicted nucleic acid-binding protein
MAVVVDASVALKWVIEEPDSGAARRLVQDEQLIAPGLLFIECANSLCTKARRGQITPQEAVAAYAAIEATPLTSIATGRHVSSAQAIALALGQTAYDSLYLAVALAERAVMVTADAKFAAAALANAGYRSAVRLLGA